jgi:murein DD-endopeptidase MepM/ murein hydrolase activator NlpD
LKSNSLTEGVFEAQALNDLNAKLALDIGVLEELQNELSAKVTSLNEKKSKTALHQKNLEVRKIILQDQKKEWQTILQATKSKESVYEKQAAELRKLQQEIAEEIESLDAELRTKIDPSLLPKAGIGVLAPPLQGELVITQKYGATSFAQSAYPGRWHNGVDFRAPVGTPVFASEAGTVAGVGNQDAYCYRGAYGKFVAINHDNNLTTLYTHLSQYVVKKGDTVERGQLIGYSGRTGYATGPHLHFTVFAQPTFYMGQSRSCGPMPFGGDLNPERYL